MKKLFYVFLFCLSGIWASCNDESGVIGDSLMPSADKNLVPLSVTADINVSIDQSLRTRSVLETIPDTARIGTFVTGGSLDKPYDGAEYKNLLLQQENNLWTLTNPVFLSTTDARVYAYYPFKAENTDGKAIPVESETQTDYLYGTHGPLVNNQNPVASLKMKHALALLKFRVYKEANVTSEPELTTITLALGGNTERILCSKGSMNIASGRITPDTNTRPTASVYNLHVPISETIPENESELPALLTLPLSRATTSDGEIKLYFYIAGKQYSCPLPSGTDFKGGTKYIYTVKLSAKFAAVNLSVIEDWKEGETGNVVI